MTTRSGEVVGVGALGCGEEGREPMLGLGRVGAVLRRNI
jgi:hypothetical protein